MADSELACAVHSLKTLYLKTDDERSGSELGKLFDCCVRLRNLIEDSSLPSNNNDFQEAIQICVKSLEKCTLMVNELELFSSNESAEELQTSSIRYLMLPAFLGSLNLAIQNKELSERLKYVEIAEVYFRDFLFRCTNYELCGTSENCLEEIFSHEVEDRKNTTTPDPALVREKKIQQYKRKKELKDRQIVLKPALERPESEEYIREYYLVLLERWIITAVEEIENLKREKDILKSLPKKGSTTQNGIQERKAETKPLKPIIITKNEIQKQVFGLGYPSIPVLTIDDFYRQRFEKMIEEQKQNKIEEQRQNKKGKSLQDTALSGDTLSKEDEEIKKEKLLDEDDPTALIKARQWDDWKDDNQRGSGNRKNKG